MSFDSIRSVVLSWDERPSEVVVPPFACAMLVCSQHQDAQLYVNSETSCSHEHLANDANALIDAFERRDLDHGWAQLPNGDIYTVIMTREAAEKGGLTGWASSPDKR